eukprot:TRINITY_DN3327_c0_g1_i1.p1 TRINITY_DN3327_c0_g1~~TRINITY_DN3327_c0_g1_i1.p1  ORF type:complete len:383 (-),score=65.79 TRINITY_DN3327_c0_g1_i1:132-1280(-)
MQTRKQEGAPPRSPVPGIAAKPAEPVFERRKDENTPITNTHRIVQAPEVPGKEQIRIDHVFTAGEPNKKIFNIRFNEDDKYIACTCDNGQVQIYNTTNGSLASVINSTRGKIPFTSVRWRPTIGANKIKNVLVTTNAEGFIQHWHLHSDKCLSTVTEEGITDSQLFGLDYNCDATKFAAVGGHPTLRIYDEYTRTLDMSLTGEACVVPGHTSRVYCAKFDRERPYLVVTGGWDFRVIVWDLREKSPIDSIYGPLICGDGIDICDDQILTSSWTDANQLQLYDLGTRKLIQTIDWMAGPKTYSDPVFLYSGQFSKIDGTVILGCGSNTNEAKLFDQETGYKHIATITDISREINTVDFANKGGFFALAGGDGYLRMFNLNLLA